MAYFSALISGISVGCLYALVALGYNLVYNATSVFNFAQGDLVSFGGLMMYFLIVTHSWSIGAVIVPVVLAVAIVAFIQERVSIAPVTRRGDASLAWVITTLGASVILENVFQLMFGSQETQVPALAGSAHNSTAFTLWHAPVTYTNLIIVLTAVACAGGLEVWSRITLTGKAWRATSEDRMAAQVRGINVRRVGILAFIVAGAVSGIAGIVTVPSTGATWGAGANYALLGFVAIALGGFGSQLGAVVGGILLGVVIQELQTWVNPSTPLVSAFALGVLLITLMARPTGLLGYRQEREV